MARKRLLRASGSRRILASSILAARMILAVVRLVGVAEIAEFQRDVESILLGAWIRLNRSLYARVGKHVGLLQQRDQARCIAAEALHLDAVLVIRADAFQVCIVRQALGQV